MGVPVVSHTAPAPRMKPTDRESMSSSTVPLPYRGAYPEVKPTKYAEEVKGVVPGYGGHVPRAQHTYGKSAVGNVAKDTKEHKDVAMARHPNTKEPTVIKDPPAYNSLVGGIVPGYGGHVPHSGFTYGKSHVGQTTPFVPTGSPSKQARLHSTDDFLEKLKIAEAADEQPVPGYINPLGAENDWWPIKTGDAIGPSFVESVGGVIPGYSGHLPKAQYEVGKSQVGSVSKGENTKWETLSQAGHMSTKVSPYKAYEPI
jgi:hypothetical protein